MKWLIPLGCLMLMGLAVVMHFVADLEAKRRRKGEGEPERPGRGGDERDPPAEPAPFEFDWQEKEGGGSAPPPREAPSAKPAPFKFDWEKKGSAPPTPPKDSKPQLLDFEQD